MKKLLILIPAVLGLIFLSTCTSKQTSEEDLIVLDFTKDVTVQSDFKLSDIAKEIKYIKLESNPDCFIQQYHKYYITNDYILVYDRRQDLIFLYNREGKFLRRISKKGKGPGEYNRPIDVRISSCGKHILIHTDKNVLRYDFEGKLTDKTELPSWTRFIDTYKDGLIGIYTSYYSTVMDNYTLVTFDWDGNITGRYGRRNWDWLPSGAPSKSPSYYRFNGLLCFREGYCDTMYYLTEDQELKPRIFVKLEDQDYYRRVPNPNPREYKESKGYSPGGWLETLNRFYFMGSINRFMHPLIFDKASKSFTYIPYDKELNTYGIPNDLDGGAPFWPARYTNKKLLRLEYANKLKRVLENELIDDSPFKNQQLRNRLLEFKDKLSEEDGLVLIDVELK